MAYSHSRLRKTLALARIATGSVFVLVGAFKVSSLEFARQMFPAFLDSGLHGAAAEWFRPVLEWIVNYGPGRVGVAIGFVELFIGVALILGLAVRPASLIGTLYSVALLLATWNGAGTAPSMLQTAEHQFRNLFPVLTFLLLGIGHAGETWGVGALYHRHRAQKWERESAAEADPEAKLNEAEQEPGSFEEFAEMEARRARQNAPAELNDEHEHTNR